MKIKITDENVKEFDEVEEILFGRCHDQYDGNIIGLDGYFTLNELEKIVKFYKEQEEQN